MVLSVRAVHTIMGNRRTITYILDDGQKVTSKQLAKELGVTNSAANNRLKRSTDPVKVFAPYNKAKGGKPRGRQPKAEKLLPYEDEMLKLALKTI
tara:strand:- start:273 stop:557 length:285 start_codon:yes stop_codon:yes gene_type:complete